MNPLNIQNTSQGTVVTYKLSSGDQLDRMTMGMLKNNHIQGILPIQYSQVDAERWIKYEVHTMIPLHAYLSGGLSRKRTLTLFEQVVETFILAEDYMIDAAFIILDPNYVFVDAFTGEVGIICLPVSGFVSDVTLREFLITITARGQFDPKENCDYVMKIRNFVSGPGFSIFQMKKMIEELTGESVQRSYREGSHGETAAAGEAGKAMAVGDVGQAAHQDKAVVNGAEGISFAYSDEHEGARIKGGRKKKKGSEKGKKGKEEKEKKGIFGRKKKKKEKKVPDNGMAMPGVDIPGMDIPGTDASKQPQTSAGPDVIAVGKQDSEPPVAVNSGAAPDLGKELPVNDSLSGISDLIIGKNAAAHSDHKPEWQVSSDYDSVGISDATVYLNMSQKENTAVLKRVRTGETVALQKEQFVLGKDTNRVDFCVSGNSTVSRVHARIIRRDDRYFVIDDNSMNHTYVNDMQIAAGQEIPLQNGCRIKLSDEEFQFVNGEEV